MEIQLDENTMLTSDSKNWIIAKKVASKKSDKGFVWVAQRFYRTPGDAIKAEANREIRKSDAESFIDAIEQVNKIAKKYDAFLTLFEDDENNS